MSMFKTALNNNIIPHIWKLANIVPIPKHNKDIDKGTSYRPISLLSVIEKALEKSLLPYITGNIPNTPTQHGYKTQHSTLTALHTLNKQCSTRYKQSFRHNKHTHTNQQAATDQDSRQNHYVNRKLHQGTQSLHNIEITLLITSIQNWHSTRAPVQVMAYADDITITSTHTQARVLPRNTYNHTYVKFLPGQNKKISH